MKWRTAAFFSFTVFASSLLLSHGAPSKPLILRDQIQEQVWLNLPQMLDQEVPFAGKFSTTPEGNWLIPLKATIPWQIPSDSGEGSVSTPANILEWSPAENKVVEAFRAAPNSDDVDMSVDDLVWDPTNERYWVLDRKTGVLLAYRFAPDEIETILVSRVRTVEVPVEPVLAVPPPVKPEPVIPDEVVISENPISTEGIDDWAMVEETHESVEPIEEAPLPMVEEQPTEPEPAPEPEYIEEIYEEAIQVVIRNRFGLPTQEMEVAALGLKSITDLYFLDETQRLIALGVDGEGYAALRPFKVTPDGELVLDEILRLEYQGAVGFVFWDAPSALWVLGSEQGLIEFTSQGRLVRRIDSPVLANMSDLIVRITPGLEGKPLSRDLVAFGAGAVRRLDWRRVDEDRIHRVPGKFPTIQAAINAAKNDDWILLNQGVYEENLRITGKSIHLVSAFAIAEDGYFIEATSLQPQTGPAIEVDADASLYLCGLRISKAAGGIISSGNLRVEHCEFSENEIGAILRGGQAEIADSEFRQNSSHGLVFEKATASLIERCLIKENGGDGVRILITPYDDVVFRTVIRRNEILGNQGAGIYFLDAPIMTQREFRIENNFIIGNKTAGLEVFLEQPDPKNLLATGPRTRSMVFLINNTIVKNPVGVLRGGNYRMINNIVAECEIAGVSDLKHHSLIIRNLFWSNKTNSIESNFSLDNNREEDPLFVGDDYILSVRSPAKQAGIPGNLWNDASDRSGADIGASR
jgi:hypothetical protein